MPSSSLGEEGKCVSKVSMEHNAGEFIVIHHTNDAREYILRRGQGTDTAVNQFRTTWTLALLWLLLSAYVFMLTQSMAQVARRPDVLLGAAIVAATFFVTKKQIVEEKLKCAGHVWSTESVLVIRDFGVQLKSKRADGSVSRKFLERSLIRAAVINEGYRLMRIHHYLAFLLDHQEELEIAFKSFFPRLPILKQVYLGIQHILFYTRDHRPLTQEKYDQELEENVHHHKKWQARLQIVAPS